MVYKKNYISTLHQIMFPVAFHAYKMVAYYGDAAHDSPVHLAQGQPLEGEWDIEGVQWLLSMTHIEYCNYIIILYTFLVIFIIYTRCFFFEYWYY